MVKNIIYDAMYKKYCEGLSLEKVGKLLFYDTKNKTVLEMNVTFK